MAAPVSLAPVEVRGGAVVVAPPGLMDPMDGLAPSESGDAGAMGGGGGGGGLGGALFNYGGSVTITNSTLSGNAAQGGAR